MFSPVIKLLSLATTVVAHYLSTAPPIPPPGPEDKVYSGQSFEFVVPLLRFGSVTALTLAIMSEFIVIANDAYPDILSSPSVVHTMLCPYASPKFDAEIQRIYPAFVSGLFFVVAGCSIRIWCYKVLGNLFTYEVTLRPGHTLVTGGPYGVVRHPSYTGLVMHFTGVAIMQFAPGGWNRECGIMATTAGWFVKLWLVLSFYTFISVWRRGDVEDQMMREQFGHSWDLYRKDVPYKFIPGVV